MLANQDLEFDAATKKLMQRRRMATESLVSSSHLRDALTDAQAQELLDWALARLDRELGETLLLQDEEAERRIDRWQTAVAGVMKGVNRLVAKLPLYGPEEADYQMGRLLSHLQQIPGPIDYGAASDLLANRHNLADKSVIFRRLMALIAPQDEEE